MLKIKLARFGKRNQPEYRIVVNEARDKRDGAYTALLGHYAPTQTPKLLSVDLEAYKTWLTKGAQPTDTVAALVKRFESGKPFPPKKKRPSAKSRAKAAAKKEAASQPKTAKPTEETPASAEPEATASETAPEASTAEAEPTTTEAQPEAAEPTAAA